MDERESTASRPKGVPQMFQIHPMNAIRAAAKFAALMYVVDLLLSNLDKLIVG